MDEINHPSWYRKGGIETIDIISAKTTSEGERGYLQATVYKYFDRHPHKENTIQDLEKVEWFLKRLKAWYEEHPDWKLTVEILSLIDNMTTADKEKLLSRLKEGKLK